MNNFYTLIFIVLIALGAATALTILLGNVKRKSSIEQALDINQMDKVSSLANASRLISSFFAASNNEITEKFIGAGIYNTALAPYFFLIKYTVFGVASAIVILTGDAPIYEGIADKITWLAGLTLVVVIGPDLYLEMRRRALALKITRKLPFLLDLMATCVQTGMTIESTLFYLTSEMASFDRDIAYMLKRLSDRARTVGLDKSLQDLYERVPSPEMHSFVMTLTQSMQHGTSVYEILTTLSNDIRKIQLLSLEEKAGKLSSKMSIPMIIFVMMPVVVLIVSPGVMRMLEKL
ncbi:type II secretion system F family protein [Enterovibrio sp. ZSDZ42]|uniref:Type II secretion system F family protein n=1 Tax=Enterovibrio gelatinilyticus TaxID=2899819 RepID=A0ABT5R326_9GAMM|nr:type II secretion system F family protein [Enterovibrio sp. ZSDZ42]MDD1794649.1 type II secretion system F family protein [Enterovibrio sp. ZSDZ42]